MEKILTSILGPMLDKMGTGWKTAAGLLGYLILAVLSQTTDLDTQYAELFAGAQTALFALFGIGIIHKNAQKAGDP